MSTRRRLALRLLGSSLLASACSGDALARVLAAAGRARDFSPPGTPVRVTSAMTSAAIQTAIAGAGSGNTVVFEGPGPYQFDADIALRSHTYFYAPEGCTIRGGGSGGWVFNADGLEEVTLNGFTFESQGVRAQKSVGCTVGNCQFTGDPPNPDRIHVEFSGSTRFTAINNRHENGTGNIYDAWDPTAARLSGNVFQDCHQGFNINFNAPPTTAARDIIIELNSFVGIGRMAIEFGGDGHPSDTRILGNWADAFAANAERVAYSIVRGRNTLIRGNFARLGPANAGQSSIGIELAGSGTVEDNDIRDFAWGVIFYSPDDVVRNNRISGWLYEPVLDYRDKDHRVAGNSGDPDAPVPPRPQRRAWLG